MTYLTAQHTNPPQTINHTDDEGRELQYPVAALIRRAQETEDADVRISTEATLAMLGVYRHVPIDLTIPTPLGVEWESYTDLAGRIYYGQIPRGTEEERLVAAKEQKHEERRQRRTLAELDPFTFNGHPMDADRDSISRISNAAIAAMTATSMGQPFNVVWACHDEYSMPLDAQGVLGLQATLAMHGSACHANSQVLKEAIDACLTYEELDAVDIEAGWPDG